MIKKLMMLCVAAMAATGAWATGEKSVVLGDWYEAHSDNEATTCARWDDFWMGASVAIPVTGLASPIPASDVAVTAGTYSEFGRPYVLTEAEMWNRYGAPVLREKNLGNVEFDWYDNVWQNWDAEEDGAYGYELSADIWPNWSQVSGRQWILIPTGVPRSGTHTFSVKINGVEHSNYVVSFVMAEDQEPVPYGYQVSFNLNVYSSLYYFLDRGDEVRTVAKGSSIGELPSYMAPSLAGVGFGAFQGWYTSKTGGARVTEDTIVNGDVTYYGRWKYYRIIEFELNGGELTTDYWPFAESGKAIGALPVPVRDGYQFVGWYTAASGGVKVTENTVITATDSNITIPLKYYARWVYDGSTTVSAYVAEGCETMGKVTGGKTAKVGTKVTLKATANKGYVFAGWDANVMVPMNGVDYFSNPTFSYVVNEYDENPTFVAYFMPVEEDWVDVWVEMDSEYTTGEEIDDIYIGVDSGSLATIKVKGLPSGLKFTDKPIDGHMPNCIYGTPKKSGVYTVEVTATTASKKTSTSSAVIVVRKENEKMVKLAVQDWYDEETDTSAIPGKVSGGGIFAEGKKVSLKATANKGFVFAGWWDVNADDWFYGPGDYLNPKLSYVMTDSDVELMAVFMPAADDWVEVWLDMAEEYTTGEEIDDIYVEVDSGSLATLKFKGLPSGLKYTAKAIYDRSGNLLHEANTIYGTPKKSGVYTVTVSATTASKKTSTSSAVIVVRKENEKMVKLAVQDWYDEDTGTTIVPGKVSGGGIFAEGKKLSLKATANKGFVFAGWWDVNAGAWLDSAEDYRNPKLSYVMSDSDMDLEAVFMPTAEDNILDLYVEGEWITANADDNVFYADGEVEVKLEIDSLSLPKASVSGLPKGMKFDAKTNMITGMPTAPGLYTVTVKLTNQSIKKAIQKKFTISVSNLTGANDYFVDGLYNGVGDKYSLSVGISNIGEFLPSLELNAGALAVSGLPSGLKYDAKTGTITGVATKAGTYTVTLTVTDGKAKYVSTITIEVESLPDWIVGTFRGSVDTEGWGWSDICSFEVKVSSQGGVSAKLIEPNPAWGSVSLKTYDLIKSSESEYTFKIWDGDIENWEECSMGEVYISKGDNGLGVLYAWEYGIDEDEDEFEAYWEGYQDIYSLSSSVIPRPTFKNDNKYYFNIDEDGGVNLTFGAKGAVTVSEPGVIWGKSQLLPIEYDSYNNVVIASLWLMGCDEREDCTFGAELILSIPVHSDGTANASEIIIEGVNAGPNW